MGEIADFYSKIKNLNMVHVVIILEGSLWTGLLFGK